MCLILFSQIKNVEFGRLGLDFELLLINGQKIIITSNWDIKGYIQLFKLIENQFPNSPAPDIEIISKYLRHHQKLMKKEINKNEFKPYFEELMKESEKLK